jgi:uncharacterized protein YegP (UPF0339 family)
MARDPLFDEYFADFAIVSMEDASDSGLMVKTNLSKRIQPPRRKFRETQEHSTIAKFQIYNDKVGEWRWRLVACGNHEIIAESAEGYATKSDCEHDIDLVKERAPGAAVVEG